MASLSIVDALESYSRSCLTWYVAAARPRAVGAHILVGSPSLVGCIVDSDIASRLTWVLFITAYCAIDLLSVCKKSGVEVVSGEKRICTRAMTDDSLAPSFARVSDASSL